MGSRRTGNVIPNFASSRTPMRVLTYVVLPLLLLAGFGLATPQQPRKNKASKTFIGEISDSPCGLKHTMFGGSAKQCTLKCVEMGAKFVLADASNNKVYQLHDQETPQKFAGERVRITGTYDPKTNTIYVASIERSVEAKACYRGQCWNGCEGKSKCNRDCRCN